MTKNKRKLIYDSPLNILTTSNHVEALRAISFYRGESGNYAGPARDMIERGLSEFIKGLSPAERARYNECLMNVRAAAGVRRSMDNSGARTDSD